MARAIEETAPVGGILPVSSGIFCKALGPRHEAGHEIPESAASVVLYQRSCGRRNHRTLPQARSGLQSLHRVRPLLQMLEMLELSTSVVELLIR